MGQNNGADEYSPPWQLNVSTNSSPWSQPLAPFNADPEYSEWTSVTISPNGNWLFGSFNSETYAIEETNWMAAAQGVNESLYWTQLDIPVAGTVLSSYDGGILVGGGYYISTNSGAIWTLLSPPGPISTLSWDGMKMAAIADASIYTSTNGGLTWLLNVTPTAVTGWSSLVGSSNGNEMAAIGNDGGIYISHGCPPPPRFQSAARNGGSFTFSWSAISGQVYQVQYTTNLTMGNWANLGFPILATNATMSASDPMAGAQGFYRIQLVQ